MNRRVAVLLVAVVLIPATAGALPASTDSKHAQLSIDQPHYVDTPVKTETANNSTIYYVSGGYQEIRPTNFNSSAVVDFGVRENGADLTYDKTTGEFKLSTGGQNGTFHVYWTVAQQQVVETGNNSTTTKVMKTRYAAQIQVQTASYEHLSQSKFEDLRSDAANWSEVVRGFSDVGPPSMSIGEKLKKARTAFSFLSCPWCALQGQFANALIILTLTPGGLLLFGLILLFPIAVTVPIYIRYRREKKRKPDMDDIQTEKDRIAAQLRKRALSQASAHELPVDGRTAEKLMENHGENVREIALDVERVVGWSRIRRIFAQAMGQKGYRVATRRASTDGGAASDDQPIADVEILPPEADADRFEDEGEWTVTDLTDPDEEVLEAIPEEEIDYHVLDDEIEPGDVDVPLASEDEVGDIMDARDIDIPEDFDSREHYAECLRHVFEFAIAHPYTDEEGAPRPERSVLNTLLSISSFTGERFDVPMFRRYRDVFLWIAEEADESQELQAAADRAGPRDRDGRGGGLGAD